MHKNVWKGKRYELWTGNLYVAHDEYTASGFRRDYYRWSYAFI